jgi:predicted HTH domain antitoxin
MQLSINVPDDLFVNINETKQNLTNMLKQKLAIELYKNGKISVSQGAKLLEVDIYAFMKLLSDNEIVVIDDYDIECELRSIV